MQTSPKYPERLEDRKVQKLMERIQKKMLQDKTPATNRQAERHRKAATQFMQKKIMNGLFRLLVLAAAATIAYLYWRWPH